MWNHSTKMFTLQFLCSKTALLEGKRLVSPYYSAAEKLWWLAVEKVEVKHRKSDSEAFISVYLFARSGPKVHVRCTMRLVASCHNKSSESTRDLIIRQDDTIGNGIRRFVHLSTLKKSDIFCYENQFLFEVDVSILAIDGVDVVHPPKLTFIENDGVADDSNSDESDSNASGLSQENESDSDDDNGSKISELVHFGCDVVVVSACGVEFACHKHILATNSVFRNVYLKGDMDIDDVPSSAKKRRCSQEEKKGEFDRIVLKDMSAHALRVVLSHIYHGSLKFDIAIAGDVLHAAETHDLPLLKHECEAFMSYKLTKKNFLDYLMIAELTNSKKLKKACLSFWPKHGNDIMETEDWKKFIDSKDEKNKFLTCRLFQELFRIISSSKKKK